MSIARLIILALAAASPFLSSFAVQAVQHEDHVANTNSPFIQRVRAATESFRDVRDVPQGYGPVLGCVSGPAEGAMGVHFVNPSLLTDAKLEAEHPEALIYEYKDGVARLVGVEYIVLFDVWHLTHGPQETPMLEGQLLHYNEAPNRFGLPAFYELHVWAWRDNPLGAFVDWNTRVSCEG